MNFGWGVALIQWKTYSPQLLLGKVELASQVQIAFEAILFAFTQIPFEKYEFISKTAKD